MVFVHLATRGVHGAFISNRGCWYMGFCHKNLFSTKKHTIFKDSNIHQNPKIYNGIVFYDQTYRAFLFFPTNMPIYMVFFIYLHNIVNKINQSGIIGILSQFVQRHKHFFTRFGLSQVFLSKIMLGT